MREVARFPRVEIVVGREGGNHRRMVKRLVVRDGGVVVENILLGYVDCQGTDSRLHRMSSRSDGLDRALHTEDGGGCRKEVLCEEVICAERALDILPPLCSTE